MSAFVFRNKGEIKIIDVDPYRIYSKLPSNRWKITFQTTNSLYSGNYIRIAFNCKNPLVFFFF